MKDFLLGRPVAQRARRARASLAFVVVASLAAAWRIDDMLHALHLPGDPSGGMGSLAAFGLEGPDPDGGTAVLEAWDRVPRDDLASPTKLGHLYLVADCAIAVALGGLLWMLAKDARNAVEPRTELNLARIFVVVRVAVVVAALADIAENVALFILVGSLDGMGAPEPSPSTFIVAYVFTGVKWSALAVVVLALGAAALGHMLGRRKDSMDLLRRVTSLRLQVLVVALFAIAMFAPVAGAQAGHVMLRWVDSPGEWLDAVLAIVFTLWFSGTALAVANRVLRQDHERPSTALGPTWLLIGGVTLGVAGGIADVTVEQMRGLWTLGLILLVLGLLALVRPPKKEQSVRTSGNDPKAAEQNPQPARPGGPAHEPAPMLLPLVIAAIPVAALGLALQRAALGEWVYAGNTKMSVLVCIGLGLQLSAWLMVAHDTRLGKAVSRVARWLESGRGVTFSVACSVLLALRIWTDPWVVSEVLGTVAIFAAFCVAASLVGFALVQPEQQRAPIPVLAALGARRQPVLIVLVLWLVLASLQDEGGYHDARTDLVTATGQTLSVSDAWRRWRMRNTPKGGRDVGRTAVPMVFVAASGGGIRAAYWTASALESAIDSHRGQRRLFALSGISGGSVGSAFYATHLVERERDAAWPRRTLGDEDHVAPTWAWMLYGDLPQAFFHVDFGPDRAEVLERSWEQGWAGRDASIRRLLQVWREGPPSRGPLTSGLRETSGKVPLLLLGSTSVQDGCRFNVSVLNADVESTGTGDDCLSVRNFEGRTARQSSRFALAGTEDLVDLLCSSSDVRLSTAALLSARFPFVSPSGRVQRCGRNDDFTYAVDGGYFDNSAASTVVEVWRALEAKVEKFNAASRKMCVVPVLLQLDNSYEEAAPPSPRRRPTELTVPLKTAQGVLGIGAGREASARQAAALLFGTRRFSPAQRYARLYPRAHPGTSAPLGWTLSDTSASDLDRQLSGAANANALKTVARWFSNDLRCLPRDGT